ncbi:MAG TPA: adenosylmethionine--8-amino-7-oxononanoate transaminase [Nevskiaceae bacterium]|nr:adenosylmethionine--8-amino-7-oxononanoate transaminase [Nevskiaceae bacterium]
MSADELRRRSLRRVWHPCTQMKDHAGPDPALPLVPIVGAEGVWLEGADGRRYLDAVSSWWTNVFGHRHPHLVASLKDQLDTLDHVIFAGFTHEPAVQLAERLCALTGHDRCLFTDNGSSAVELALKLSFHTWKNLGQPQKRRFIALTHSYHGETLGALAVGETGLYRNTYEPLLLEPIHVPSPDCSDRAPGVSWEDHTRARFRALREVLAREAGTVCAVILEPLVQCAGGMRMYHPVYLRLLREACDEFGVHLIADEIAVGFGRSGRLFACEWAPPAQPGGASGIRADFLCLSKGLTGGTLPLAVVLTGESVYEAFYAEHREGRAFLHSHSYSGNPLACRAALATLDLFAGSDVMGANRLLSQFLWSETNEALGRHPRVGEIRQQGMILALDLVREPRSRRPFDPTERRGLRAYRHALASHPEGGAVLRPLGDTLYFMPPYVITPKEIRWLVARAAEAVDAATRG